MKKTQIIIFSKNRTLQLKSLILSLKEYSDISESEINVLYREEPGISYELLIKQFECNFVLQNDFFYDLNTILSNSDSSYILFMVDDLIFRDEFSLRRIEKFLDDKKDVDCLSLRLGRNIEDGKGPDFSVNDGNILVWDTSGELGYTWKYFWEVSSSIYRIEHVLKYLNKCDARKISFPNPFESYYYSIMPSFVGSPIIQMINSVRNFTSKKSNRMACFETSKCFTQGVNMVAERDTSYKTIFGPLELHAKLKEGYIIDYRSLKDVKNLRPNVGKKHFRLIKEN